MKATTLRVLALLLVAIMMVGMFAGCAEEPGTTTTKPAPNTTAGAPNTTGGNNTTGNVNTSSTKYVYPDVKTLTIQMKNACGGDIDFMTALTDTNVGPVATEILKSYGLEINWVPVEADQYGTFLQTTFAGGLDEMADVIYTDGGNTGLIQEVAEADLILAIQDILEYSKGNAKKIYEDNPYYFVKNNLADGKTYWLGEIQDVAYHGETMELGRGAPTGIMVRQDWLKALNMEIPDTLEELEAYIKACQAADLNGTGLGDIYHATRWSNGWTRTGLEEFLGVCTNGEFVLDLADETVTATWKQDGIKDVIKLIKEWGAKGLVHPDCFTGGSTSTMIRNNQSASFYSYFCDNWTDDKLQEIAPDALYIGVMPDTTAHPDAYIGHDAAPQLDVRNICFSADADPEACARLLDCIASPEWMEMIIWGTEGESFTINDKGEYEEIGNATSWAAPGSTPMSCVGHSIFSQNALVNLYKAFDAEEDAILCENDEILAQYEKGLLESDIRFVNQINAYMAAPTEEEAETMNDYSEYNTTSKEILMQCLTGQIDIDTEWESKVIEPLKAAGMDEIEAVYQARVDRYLEAYHAARG